MLQIEKENYNSIFYKAIYSNRKLSRNKVEDFKIERFISKIKNNLPSNLKELSLIVLGLTKINKKQYRYLLEECNKIFLAMNFKNKKTSPAVKVQKKKISILDLDINSTVLNNDTIEPLNEGEIVFNDNLVEEVRNATMLSENNMENLRNTNLVENESAAKKIKIIKDKFTEFSILEYKRNAIENKIENFRNKDFYEKLNEKLFINEEIEQFLEGEIKKHKTEKVPEIFSDNFENVDIEDLDNISLSSNDNSLNLLEQEKSFTFNELVEKEHSLIKVCTFYKMLELGNENKIKISQKEAFGNILCELN